MSIKKKLQNLSLQGLAEGLKNKITGDMEETAKQRAEICRLCPHNVVEPIEELRVKDNKIPSITNKMCDLCGCALPYLLRQTKKACKAGKW